MSRTRTLIAVPLAALVLSGCGASDEPPVALAQPSAECEDAFRAAAEEGERSGPESPRSPDIDALQETLDACGSADAWRTAARGNASALPLELDLESALDQLCQDHGGTPVCEDWGSGGAG